MVVTGPTDRQVKEIVFREVETQYLNFLRLYPQQGFKRDWLTTNALEFDSKTVALGFVTKETNEMIGKASGFHAGNVLIIVTEAQAVMPSTFKQIKGLITSKNSRILELGNPLIEFGDFYDHCTNPRYNYHVIHLPCSMSPNVVAGEEIIPGMATVEYINRMQQDCGPDYEGDAEYQGRVLAQFPQQSKNAWIPLQKIKEAAARKFDPENDDILVAGLDTAGEGDDETVFSVFRGPQQIKQETFRKIIAPETVGWARDLIENFSVKAMAIDEGYNKGISGWLNYESLQATILSVNFGAESPHEKLENFGTYMWYLAREAFMSSNIAIIDDPVLISQLSSRRVETTPRGKLRLASKKREGKKSPDRADALVMAWYVRLQMISGLGFTDFGENASTQLDQVLTKLTPGEFKRRNHNRDSSELSAPVKLDAEELRF